jgi:hypothetical protein
MASPVVLINPESGNAEQFAPEQAQQVIQSGYHVPLVDQQGQAYAAPFQEAQQLVQSGTHAQPNSAQLQTLLDQAHYGAPEQQALGFVEGMLEPNTAGLYGKVAAATGLTTEQDILKRQQYNPGTHALGEAAGLVGGIALAPEASIPGLISKAGGAAAKAVGTSGFFGKAAALAAQGAVEGGLYAATHEINEKLIGEPDAVGEGILGDIGLSAALGAGLNLALAPAFSGIAKVFGQTKGLAATAREETVAGARPSTLEEIMPHTGIPQEEQQNVLKGLGELRPNIKEFDEAAKEIGAPDISALRSDSKFVKNTYSSLLRDPSWTGISQEAELKQGYGAVRNAVNDALGNDVGKTLNEVGKELQAGIENTVRAEYEPVKQVYDLMKETGATVAANRNTLDQVSSDILKMESLVTSKGAPLSETSSGYRLAKRFSEEIKGLHTVDDIQRYMGQISKDIAIPSQQEKFIIGEVKSELNNVIESSIKEAAQTIDPANPLRQKIEELLLNNDKSKVLYAGLKDKIGSIGKAVGKNFRGGQGVEAFVDWINEVTPEKLAKRLFTKENADFLEFFKKNFPQQAELLSNLQRTEIRDAAMKAGQLDPTSVLRQIGKLEPEAKKFLFTEDQIKKLKASELWTEVARDATQGFNPSETARAIQWFDVFKNPISMATTQAASLAKKNLINQLVRANPGQAPLITALVHLQDMAVKTARNMERYSGAIFSRPLETEIQSSRRENKKDRAPSSEPLKMDKIGTLVMNHSSNPEALIDHLTTATGPISGYAPASTGAFSTSVGRAVNFLASKVPSEGKVSPFDAPRKPSNTEIAKFNRYASIVDNPIQILKEIKKGTILPQDIETLSTVYPTLYNKMKETVTHKLIEHAAKKDAQVPYTTRLGLSLFLGQNLDSTLSPQGIMANQSALLMGSLQQQAKQMAQNTRPSKSGMRQMKSINNDLTKSQSSAERIR